MIFSLPSLLHPVSYLCSLHFNPPPPPFCYIPFPIKFLSLLESWTFLSLGWDTTGAAKEGGMRYISNYIHLFISIYIFYFVIFSFLFLGMKFIVNIHISIGDQRSHIVSTPCLRITLAVMLPCPLPSTPRSPWPRPKACKRTVLDCP